MITNSKQEFLPFQLTDLGGIEEHMESMAAEGWELTSFGTYCKYKEAESEKLRFNAVLLPFGTKEAPDDYIALCEEAGWEYVGNSGNVFLFKTSNESIPDIETDPAEELEAVSAQIKKNRRERIATIIGNLVIVLLCIGLHFLISSKGKTTWFYIVTAIAYGFAAFFKLLTHIHLSSQENKWSARAEKALHKGLPIPYFGKDILPQRKSNYWFALIINVISLVLLGVIFSLTFAKEYNSIFFAAAIGAVTVIGVIHLLARKDKDK